MIYYYYYYYCTIITIMNGTESVGSNTVFTDFQLSSTYFMTFTRSMHHLN